MAKICELVLAQGYEFPEAKRRVPGAALTAGSAIRSILSPEGRPRNPHTCVYKTKDPAAVRRGHRWSIGEIV